MNDMSSAILNRWPEPEPSAKFLAKHPAADVEAWRILRGRVNDLATPQGWTKAETGRRIGMAESTFSQWLSGTLDGVLDNANSTASKWLDAMEERASMVFGLPQSPAFFRTRAAAEIHATLQLAQVMSGLVTITLDTGRGKTVACEAYRDSRPHVHMITLNPKVKGVHGAMGLLARTLGIRASKSADLVETVGEKLSARGGGSLLVIDEAQHADAETVNQVRYFSDQHKVGVALVGNDEIRHKMASGQSSSTSRNQILRRIYKNLKKDPGREEDVRAFIAAWGINDPASVKYLTGIGMKSGSLGQIDQTLKMAHLSILGTGETLERRHIEAAWKNRDVEDF